ncbi:nuclease-related domain-containing protein [Nocardia sp. alder85J]|uniref:nuclease-related domain-containing protein n=1 Tax=Nocardia sp. alder85J TaxID=2862949 RepID=UPI001CD37B43|nr:nuclease-related domain-containing protein [Nocardia sp. alder85J]MCX4092641.1 nuclease-related domain-containing protein [Nocardia sp. alder85J]
MLVRVQNAAGTQAERVLIEWLRQWKEPDDPHGVAIVNCSLFYQDRLHQFDAVVWTPTTCVVIEAETLVERISGELEVPPHGPWRVGGQVVTLEGEDRRGPTEVSREHTFALQSWLAERGLGQRVVFGVVLVVPPNGSHLRIRQLWNDNSLQVLLGDDPNRLRDYLEAQASLGRAEWTANDVALSFRGLGILPFLPAPQDLVVEGFVGPVDTTLWRGGPQQAQAELYDEEQSMSAAEAAGALPFTMPWYSPWELYPRRSEGVDLGQTLMRVMLALGMLVAVAWVIWFVLAVVLHAVT